MRRRLLAVAAFCGAALLWVLLESLATDAPAYTLRGRVVQDGHPVAGAQVRFGARAQRTGNDGRFEFPLQPQDRAVLWAAAGDGALVSRVARVSGRRRPLGEVELAVAPAARLEGEVRTRADLARVPGARVRLERPAGFEAVTDARGAWAIEGLPEGEGSLIVDAPGYRSTRYPLRVYTPGEALRLTVLLDMESRLSGRVVDEQGAGVAGAEVVAARRAGGAERGRVRTDRDGRFELGGLLDRTYWVEVRAPGFEVAQRYAQPSATGALEVALARGTPAAGSGAAKVEEVDDDPPDRGGLVRGRVLGAEGGAMAHFTVNDVRYELADGRFLYPAPPDEARLTVAALGHVPREVTAQVEAGATADIGDVPLRRAPEVTVRVLAADGTPAPLAWIYAVAKDAGTARAQLLHGKAVVVALAGPDGVARPRLAPGAHCLIAALWPHPPTEPARCQVDVSDEGPNELFLQFERAAWVEGTAPPGAIVQDAEEENLAQADAAGRYRLGPLMTGAHTLRLLRADRPGEPPRQVRPVDLPPGVTTTVDFDG